MQSINSQFDLLGRLIEASEMRQRVIANNLTNVTTPNYRRMDVEFETQLAQELQGSTTGQSSVECCRSLPSNTPPALLRFWPSLSAESG